MKNKIEELLIQHYDMKVSSVKQLAGEIDLNYKVVDANSNQFTLKISGLNTDVAWIDLQSKILNHINTKNLSFQVPKVILTKTDKSYFTKTFEEGERIVRLQSWVDGVVYAEAQPKLPTLLTHLGNVAGQMSAALADFDHSYAHREFHWDNAHMLNFQDYLKFFREEEQKDLVQHFLELYAAQKDKMDALRKSVCYNDLNDYNILTKIEKESWSIHGVIDFGDAVYTQTVNELAIACAYSMMHHEDPLEATFHLVKGFHEIYPLLDEEIEVLYYLIAARLVISVCHSSKNLFQEPENEYLQISAEPAWNLLKRWRSLNPTWVLYRLRTACNLAPCPKASLFNSWLDENFDTLCPPMDIGDKSIGNLDLGIGSKLLYDFESLMEGSDFTKMILEALDQQGADVGVGGYGEVRGLYSTDSYVESGNDGVQWRTVHLGIDIWDSAQTPVYAIADAEVHSVANHNRPRDYGGTVILKHTVTKDLIFYTLYGHLNWSSIEHWQSGDPVQDGEKIGLLGDYDQNGHWPPHLHFQVMLDLVGNKDDFPGVAYPREWKTWKSLCPLIPFYGQTVELNDPSLSLAQRRKKALGPNLSLSYRQPLHMVRGYKQYLYDRSGRRYLDTINNVAHVGHEHPRIVKAGQQQMAVLNTNTRYLHESIIVYAEALLSTMPEPLEVCYFVNSGSEANELALRMARTYRNRQDIVAVEVGYHGNTGNTIDVSSYKFDQPGGAGKPQNTHLLPMPDTFRGLHRGADLAGKRYAAHMDQIIADMENNGKQPAGVIIESILSCGGQIELPSGYLQTIYEKIRAVDGLCIADEVQVGFGRVGSHFWGFELQGVVPDIVTLGKPIGNGHPIGAVVCTRAVADAFDNGMEYFNTYGGNPVSCAIGLEVLNVIQDEKLQSHAKTLGDYMKSRLIELNKRFPILADVRGQGLFLGFEMIRDMEQLTPADWEADYLVNRMRSLGYLMSTDGPDHNVIKIKPPMCIQERDVDEWMDTLEMVLAELRAMKGAEN